MGRKQNRDQAFAALTRQLQQKGVDAPSLSEITRGLFERLGGTEQFVKCYHDFLERLWSDENCGQRIKLDSFRFLTGLIRDENAERNKSGDLSNFSEEELFALLQPVAVEVMRQNPQLLETVAEELGYALVSKQEVIEI